MKKIGILFGVENSFPSALVERINNRNPSGIQAEFVQTGAVHLHQDTALRCHSRPHLPRHSVLSRIPQARRVQRNSGRQQSLLVLGRRQISQLHTGRAAGRRRAAHRAASAQGISERDQRKVAAQSRISAGLGQRPCRHRRARLLQADPRRRLARCARVPWPRRILPRLRSDA